MDTLIYVLSDVYIGCIALAFLCSLLAGRLHQFFHLKLFSALLGYTLVVECMAVYARRLGWLTTNNLTLYNVFMLVEFWVYACFFYFVIQGKKSRKLIGLFLYVFPLFWLVMVFLYKKIDQWNSPVAIAGCISTIILCAFFYYQLFTSKVLIRLTKSIEFWIATGLILFYSCNLVYLGLLDYLNKNYPELATKFIIGLKISNIILYCILSYAYLCIILYRSKPATRTVTHV